LTIPTQENSPDQVPNRHDQALPTLLSVTTEKR
jgi:hypothetical protein